MAEPNEGDQAAPEVEVGSHRRDRIPVVIAAGVVAIAILGGILVWHAEGKTNKVALAASPKPVTVLAAREEPFRAVHSYVGALRPWFESEIGPQFISAY